MAERKRVLLVGLDPALIDFTNVPGLNAEKVRAGVNADVAKLTALGYDVRVCETDLGATAEAVVSQALAAGPVEGVMIGGGIRTLPEHFLLFERLINLVHHSAPAAKLCFNTNPRDTTEAVQRWV